MEKSPLWRWSKGLNRFVSRCRDDGACQMNRMGYRGQFLVWLLMGMVTFCLVGASVAWVWRPHRIQTHLDAVAYVLDRQGIAYNQIRVAHTLTGLLQRDAYAAGIIIQLPD